MARQGRGLPSAFQIWTVLSIHLICSATAELANTSSHPKRDAVPAFFIFGDSTVDTGNQNFISSVVRSDFPPYGRDFVPPGASGRFSNGKLANDYIG